MVNLARNKLYFFAKLPLLNVMFALVYFALAQFGMMWSSLTSNVTLVWPAAGVALFGLLLFGLRVAPGIFIGAFTATLFLHFDPNIGRSFTSIAFTFLMTCADLLQSWLIARMNRGLFTRNLLISLPRALYFIGSIFICCSISSSIGVNSLYYLNIIPQDELIKSWAFWWMGDSIGMLVVTSILAWALIPRIRHNNPQAQAFLLLCAGVGVVLFLVSALGYVERNSAVPLIPEANDLRPWYLPSWLQLSALAMGLTLIGLLTAYLRARQKNDDLFLRIQQKLEEDVSSHTEALRAANDWLLNEIVQRQQTQEQLQASQAALKEREQHLRSLLDNIPDPIWLKNMEGFYISCNKAFAQMLGRPEHEVLGKTEQQLVTPELADLFRHYDQQALRSHEPHRYEQWISIANQQRYLLDTLKVALRDDEGKPTGILGIGRDITEKNLLFTELEKFKRFAEYSSQGFGIATLDAETIYMNASMRTMLNGVLGDGNFKQQFWQYFPVELQQHVRDEIIPQVLREGQWQGELAALHPDGSQFPTHETFFVIRDDQGKPQYIGNIMTDISAQKETETQLSRAKETAEEATRAKSRFLANMSHEIRTPLNAVLGYTQLLMRDEKFTGNQRERLELILTSSQRLLGLINDILDLSKIESGVLNLRKDYFDLHQEIDDIQTIMAERASAKGLQLITQIDLPAPYIVKGDRQKIGQILLNLLGNAIKFTPHGSVSLQVMPLPANNVEFVIGDTGPGIAEKELAELFAAFKQGQAGEDAGGTGLGLALSRHLAEGMGGSLRLSSVLGQGTLAYLMLPLASENIVLEQRNNQASHHLEAGSHCRALVVEDDQASCDILVDLLRQIGCETLAARDGHEGLLQCASHNFDIIFTDIRMPGINGLDMLRKLRTDPAYRNTPIIAVSASSLEHERAFYLAQGFQEFIGKPYAFDDIFNALSRFAQVRFAGQDDKPVAAAGDDNAIVDIAIISAELEELARRAASGDMSNSKKIIANLTPAQLGNQRHQQLLNAVRQYDLERIEKLVHIWLAETR